MAIINPHFAGDLWDVTDYNAIHDAFLSEHLNTAGANPHANTINLGDGSTNSDRAVNANRLGGIRSIKWVEANSRWELNNGAGFVPLVAGAASLELAFIPTYPGEISRFTSSAVVSTFAEEWDAANFHSSLKLDNRDSGVQTGESDIRFRMPASTPPAGRVASIRIWNHRTGVSGSTFLGVQLFDATNTSITLTGAGAIQNSGWTETVITVTGGTYTAGGYVTLRLIFSAAAGEQVYSGEIAVTLSDS